MNHFKPTMWAQVSQKTKSTPRPMCFFKFGTLKILEISIQAQGMKSSQRQPTTTRTLWAVITSHHNELWWNLATQKAQPLSLVGLLHTTWSLGHYSKRNWWWWCSKLLPKPSSRLSFLVFSGCAWKTANVYCRNYMLWLIVLGQWVQRGSWEVSVLWKWFGWGM